MQVWVSDTGPGIPEEDLKRIFDPFFTSRQSSKGLGLAICQGIARVHGGEIDVQTASGGGAEFLFGMPVEGVRNDEKA